MMSLRTRIESLTEADRAELRRRMPEVQEERGKAVRSVLVLAGGVVSAAIAFVFVKQPDSGALTAAAVLLLIAGIGSGVVGALRLLVTAAEWRILSLERRLLETAERRGEVRVLDVNATAAYGLPSDDEDALAPILFWVGDGGAVVIEGARFEVDGDPAALVPREFQVRFLEEGRILGLVVGREGPSLQVGHELESQDPDTQFRTDLRVLSPSEIPMGWKRIIELGAPYRLQHDETAGAARGAGDI